MFVTKKEKTCCFTGHRVIAPAHREAVARRLERQIRQLIQDGICDFIAGGARGFDTLAAETVLGLRQGFPHIRLILALPCRDQTRGWSQGEKLQYERIAARADVVHYLAETYDSGCMMRRNRFMVEHSTSCVFYLIRMRSGTYKTVEYAMEQGHTLYNILCEE